MTDVKKPVVVYRLGSLGDTIVALPCLHKIEETFPHSERIALTNFPVSSKASPLGSIVGDSGLIQRTLAYPVGLRSPLALIRLARRLRALGASTLIYLTPPRGLAAAWRDWMFFRMCGFTRIVGAPLNPALQHSLQRTDGTYEPEYSRLARCMAELGPIDLSSRASWDLRLTAAERSEAARLLAPLRSPALARARAPSQARPYIAVNMGGKVARNDWGIDNWSALMRRLATPLAGHGLLILGGSEDEARASLVASAWSGVVVSACGRASPRVSGAAAEGATLFIGHDSGPMHLAASVGVACVGLFGDNNPPSRWHPPGPTHRPIHKMTGVLSITVDEVVSAVESILHDSGRDLAAPRTRSMATTSL